MTMVKPKAQTTVAAGEFKAKCLRIMDEVAASRRGVIVTKKGKPVVKIVPIDDEPADDVFGCLAEEITITGDIEAPVLPASSWKMLKK